jgi:hypothetical protein
MRQSIIPFLMMTDEHAKDRNFTIHCTSCLPQETVIFLLSEECCQTRRLSRVARCVFHNGKILAHSVSDSVISIGSGRGRQPSATNPPAIKFAESKAYTPLQFLKTIRIDKKHRQRSISNYPHLPTPAAVGCEADDRSAYSIASWSNSSLSLNDGSIGTLSTFIRKSNSASVHIPHFTSLDFILSALW